MRKEVSAWSNDVPQLRVAAGLWKGKDYEEMKFAWGIPGLRVSGLHSLAKINTSTPACRQTSLFVQLTKTYCSTANFPSFQTQIQIQFLVHPFKRRIRQRKRFFLLIQMKNNKAASNKYFDDKIRIGCRI
jgi:hypothetical protein